MVTGENRQAVLRDAFEQHFDDLYRYAALRAGPTAAEDVVAETFLRATELLARWDPERGTVRAWLFGIAANVVRETRRRSRRSRAGVGQGGSGEDMHGVVERLDAASIVPSALARLPARLRDPLVLVDGFDLTYEEAAHALGVPVGTVASRLSVGRRRFASALGAMRREGTD